MRVLREVIENPDGSYSTKRLAGWITLFFTLASPKVYGTGEDFSEIFFSLVGLTAAFFGLTTVDNNIFKRKVEYQGKESAGVSEANDPLARDNILIGDKL